MLISVCSLDELILSFYHSNLKQETDEFELALPITLVIQVNRGSKCTSHPKSQWISYNFIF